jgi:hypothetical protein
MAGLTDEQAFGPTSMSDIKAFGPAPWENGISTEEMLGSRQPVH